MAQMIDIDLRPGEATLRSFGFIAVAGFGLLAALAWFEALVFAFGLGSLRVPLAMGFAIVAGLCGLFSLVFPRANLPVYLLITIVTYPIGFVLSHVILVTLFYVIISPIGLLLRAFGTDPMQRRILPEASSYWEDAPPPRSRSSYFKQF